MRRAGGLGDTRFNSPEDDAAASLIAAASGRGGGPMQPEERKTAPRHGSHGVLRARMGHALRHAMSVPGYGYCMHCMGEPM